MFVTKEEYESMTESQKVVVKRLKDTIEMLVECGTAMSMYRDGTTNYENAKNKFDLISNRMYLDIVQ